MKPSLNRLPLLALLLCFTILHAEMVPDQATWSLERLMLDLAAIESRSNRFTESKELAILELTLTQTGILHFQSPDKLDKQILAPVASAFEIDGPRLTIKSAGNPDQVMMLDDNPQLRAFAESLRAVLAGDLPALQRHFHTRLEGSSEHWQLILQPVDKLLARQIEQIEVQGDATEIRRFIVLENGGDRTTTSLEPFSD